VKNTFGRKVAAVATLGLMAATLVAGGSAANAAANKANGACTKAGAKVTIGKTAYVCGVSPIATTKNLTWVSANCTTAYAVYTKAAKQQQTLVDAETFALTKLQNVINSFQTSVTDWQKLIDADKKVIADMQAKNPKADVTRYTNQMNSATIRLTNAQKQVASWTAQMESTKSTQDILLAQGADNVKQAKGDVTQICKSGL
jgi:hypothetical protein